MLAIVGATRPAEGDGDRDDTKLAEEDGDRVNAAEQERGVSSNEFIPPPLPPTPPP